MAAPKHRKGVEPPRKRLKTDVEHSSKKKYALASEIHQGLSTTNSDVLIEALTALRNQLTIRHDEPSIATNDERLILARNWLQAHPVAKDLFDIWERTTLRQPAVLALVVSTLSTLITLLSSHYEYHSLCQDILKNLLSDNWTHRLNSYLGGTHSELILVTLKLYNATSNFAAGRERRAVMDAFSWDAKSMSKLLYMRRKGKAENNADILVRPDIRTLYILFILSFIDATSPTILKSAFLEQHRDALLSIFKGLAQDAYPIVRKVLEVCWGGLWIDVKLKRTAKIQLFGEQTLTQLLKLYARDAVEDNEPEHVPADLVHHFLLAICTRPGTGVCFKDRGWYARNIDDDAQSPAEGSSETQNMKIFNKILANILRVLKINEDLRQQELAIKILSACPELVASFWSAAGLTLEPRLSSKWIANIAIFGTVLSFPVPISTFRLSGDSGAYHPTPPPLFAILGNILPAINTKVHLTKGLQSTSPLVRHCTALALAKCLDKLGRVVRAFRDVATGLEEDEHDGQWSARCRDVEREVGRRAPDFQVIIAFAHQKATNLAPSTVAPSTLPSASQDTLLDEVAHRLLSLYHAYLPSLVAEARYDAGKSLQKFAHSTILRNEENSGKLNMSGLHTLRRLHVLAILRETDQFSLGSKAGSSTNTNLHILLSEYISTNGTAVRSGIAALIQKHLATTLLFQHDPDEIHSWLSAIPITRRAPDAHTADGTPLSDERETIVSFLDECIQRCTKTPYRYLEEFDALLASTVGQPEADSVHEVLTSHSPLLMTVLEQLSAKTVGMLLTPSELLAIASFSRKLLFLLATTRSDLRILRECAKRLATVLRRASDLLKEHPMVATAIVHEVNILLVMLDSLQGIQPSVTREIAQSSAADAFLDAAYNSPISRNCESQASAAAEILDWVRLTGHAITWRQFMRLFELVKRLDPKAAQELIWYLDPSQKVMNIDSYSSLMGLFEDCAVPFSWVFAQTSINCLGDTSYRAQLVHMALSAPIHEAYHLTGATMAITHRLSSQDLPESVCCNLIALLRAIIAEARKLVPPKNFKSLQSALFTEPGPIRDLCFNRNISDIVHREFEQLVRTCLNPEDESDKQRVSSIVAFWVSITETVPAPEAVTCLSNIALWSEFAELDEQLKYLDWICNIPSSYMHDQPSGFRRALKTMEHLAAIPRIAQRLAVHLQRLLAIRRQYKDDKDDTTASLDNILTFVAASFVPLGIEGLPLSLELSSDSIASVCDHATSQWTSPYTSFAQKQDLLNLEAISLSSQPKVLVSMIYRSRVLRLSAIAAVVANKDVFGELLPTANVLHAICDASIACGEEVDFGNGVESIWLRVLRGTLDHNLSIKTRATCSDCASSMFVSSPSRRDFMVSAFQEELRKVPVDRLTFGTLSVCRVIFSTNPTTARPLMIAVADHALKWVVRYYAEGLLETDDTVKSIHALTLQLENMSNIKTHLVEPSIVAIIEHKLFDPSACRLARQLLVRSSIKPVVINRYLQSIIQHPSFFKYSALGSPARDAVVALLHAMFLLHPSNTCQPSHVEPLVKIYQGTLSESDRTIFAIFQLFETQRSLSVASLLGRWSATPDRDSSDVIYALQSLEPARVLRTCLAFPMDRRVVEEALPARYTKAEHLYDPVFILLLFARMLEEGTPTYATVWVELFRTNVVSLLLRCLSAKHGELRDLALSQIAGLWKAMENADLQERPHVLYILQLVKGLIPPNTILDDPDSLPRVPSYTTLLLAHAFRALFYPSSFLYPLTARFLLQRPTLDSGDVPMLFAMLYSSDEEWRKERGWIVRFLADGMTGSSEDWRVFKRRHTWDLLASLFQSEARDRVLRHGILDVLLALTANKYAATSLILKSALLSWIETQLHKPRDEEAIMWIKILENIVVVVDPHKMDASTGGQWRNTLARCISSLLNCNGINLMCTLCRVILRLNLVPGLTATPIQGAIVLASSKLQVLEATLDLSTASSSAMALHLKSDEAFLPPIPHTPHAVESSDGNEFLKWGACVEALWRSCMELETKSAAWDALSTRMLLWRSIVGPQGSSAGEWARRQVVAIIGV